MASTPAVTVPANGSGEPDRQRNSTAEGKAQNRRVEITLRVHCGAKRQYRVWYVYPACTIPSPDLIHVVSFGIHSSFTTTRVADSGEIGWSMMAKRVNNKPVPDWRMPRLPADLRRVA